MNQSNTYLRKTNTGEWAGIVNGKVVATGSFGKVSAKAGTTEVRA